ncbi:hypothetical protein P154DRAFT_519245, partial [Amniculicola lignicola CBS 123094]
MPSLRPNMRSPGFTHADYDPYCPDMNRKPLLGTASLIYPHKPRVCGIPAL